MVIRLLSLLTLAGWLGVFPLLFAQAAPPLARVPTQRRLPPGTSLWLHQFGQAEIAITAGRQDALTSEGRLALLLPWSQQKHYWLFNQLEMSRDRYHTTVSLGIGQRWGHTLRSHSGYTGYNLFFDHRRQGNHNRLGAGLEHRNANLLLALNGYCPLSDWRSLEGSPSQERRPARGMDLQLHYSPQRWQQLRFNAVAEHYLDNAVILLGNPPQRQPTAFTLGADYTPVPLITVGYDCTFDTRQHRAHRLKVSLIYRLGTPLAQQLDRCYLISMARTLEANQFALVRRHAQVRLQQQTRIVQAPVAVPPPAGADKLPAAKGTTPGVKPTTPSAQNVTQGVDDPTRVAPQVVNLQRVEPIVRDVNATVNDAALPAERPIGLTNDQKSPQATAAQQVVNPEFDNVDNAALDGNTTTEVSITTLSTAGSDTPPPADKGTTPVQLPNGPKAIQEKPARFQGDNKPNQATTPFQQIRSVKPDNYRIREKAVNPEQEAQTPQPSSDAAANQRSSGTLRVTPIIDEKPPVDVDDHTKQTPDKASIATSSTARSGTPPVDKGATLSRGAAMPSSKKATQETVDTDASRQTTSTFQSATDSNINRQQEILPFSWVQKSHYPPQQTAPVTTAAQLIFEKSTYRSEHPSLIIQPRSKDRNSSHVHIAPGTPEILPVIQRTYYTTAAQLSFEKSTYRSENPSLIIQPRSKDRNSSHVHIAPGTPEILPVIQRTYYTKAAKLSSGTATQEAVDADASRQPTSTFQSATDSNINRQQEILPFSWVQKTHYPPQQTAPVTTAAQLSAGKATQEAKVPTAPWWMLCCAPE